METSAPPSNFRAQRKGQNARQAMMISGLSTIYRNNTDKYFYFAEEVFWHTIQYEIIQIGDYFIKR